MYFSKKSVTVMKIKLLALAAFYFLAQGAVGQDAAPEPIHHIIIYKWAIAKDSAETEAIIKVDAEGKIVVTRRDADGENNFTPQEQFDMKRLEKALFEWFADAKIQKKAAYAQSDIDSAIAPQPGKQVLYVTVVTVKDFNQKGNNFYPAEYLVTLTDDFDDEKPEGLFDAFNKKERKLLRKLIYGTLAATK
jgi:hypothetical protein